MRATGWTSGLVAAIISAALSSSSLAFWRGVGLSAATSVTASRARANVFMRNNTDSHCRLRNLKSAVNRAGRGRPILLQVEDFLHHGETLAILLIGDGFEEAAH